MNKLAALPAIHVVRQAGYPTKNEEIDCAEMRKDGQDAILSYEKTKKLVVLK